MALLTKERVFEAKDYVSETVEVKEWGGDVVVRSLSMGKRYQMNEYARMDNGKIDRLKFIIGMLAYGISSPIFSIKEAEKLVNERSEKSIELIADRIWQISGMSGSAEAGEGSPKE